MQMSDTVHLLLNAPGQAPVDLPPSSWRSWVLSDRGPVAPDVAARSLRLPPLAGRGERALVAAVADDDTEALTAALEVSGPAHDAARVLWALRHVDLSPAEAASILGHLVAEPGDVTENKVLRRHWAALHLHVAVAPGVPALVPLGRIGLALVLAELLVGLGRAADALTVLGGLPPEPAVLLARTATLLAHGDHDGVIAATVDVANVDDVSALVLVARSVAARSLKDLPTALDAACAALSVPTRSLGVMAAALEERAHVYTLAGDPVAAQGDLAALAAVAEGALRVVVPEVTPLRRGDPERPAEHSAERARDRMRRRIAVGTEPGMFGGRHHSTYREEIANMFSLGQVVAVEELLLGLLDVVEDEVDELGKPLDPTFFLTLADLYQDSGRTEDLRVLRERYHAAQMRAQQNLEAQQAEAAARAAEEAVAAEAATVEALETSEAADADHPAGEGSAAPPAGDDPAVSDLDALAAALTSDDPASEDAAARAEADARAAREPEAIPVGAPPRAEPRELTPVERAVRGPRVRSL